MVFYDATPDPEVFFGVWLLAGTSLFYGVLIFVRPQLADHWFFYDAIFRLKGRWAAMAFLVIGLLVLGSGVWLSIRDQSGPPPDYVIHRCFESIHRDPHFGTPLGLVVNGAPYLAANTYEATEMARAVSANFNADDPITIELRDGRIYRVLEAQQDVACPPRTP